MTGFGYTVDPVIEAALQLVQVPEGFTKSPSRAQPPEYMPNTLYAWPLRQEARSVQMDGGLRPEMWFFLRFAWSVGTGEVLHKNRKEGTSDSIDDGIAAIVDALVSTPTNDVWEGIEIDRIDPGAIVTFNVRAGHVDVSGYRLPQS